MSRFLFHASLVSIAVASCLAVMIGCTGRPGRIYPPKIAAAEAAAEAMKQYDANQDGKIDAEELKNCAFFKDLAKDGVVTREAIEAEIVGWQKKGIGRVTWMAQFSHGNKPLAKAKVKMVPEKFLGPNVVAAEGVTDHGGAVAFTIPLKSADDFAGIQLGFYRIEVTKDGEDIPAKYNTQSTLCVRVADRQGAQGTRFSLVY
jgi:hypothetical protein